MTASWETVAALMGLVGVATCVQLVIRSRHRRREGAAQATLADLAEMGEVAPSTRYPKIDESRCVGSGGCVYSCHEHALAIVGGTVKLVNPLGCVGHGHCEAACGFGAISLVYGTASQPVELPKVSADFQTNQPGIYIAGELGGMGLIRNAVEQGRLAAEHVAQSCRRGSGEVLDAVIVGAGPAGIAATLQLMKEGKRFVTLDREQLGGTIMHYPRAKIVMTGALDLPLYGTVRRRSMLKEEVVTLWQDIDRKVGGMPVRTGELVEALDRDADGTWAVRSTSGQYRAANVILALGRRGSPRKLGVPGEEQAKVAYAVLEPEVFRDQHVLVVGGGNAAVESALSLIDHGHCASVSISYRRAKFARCRGENRRRIDEAMADGRVHALLETEVVHIALDRVTLRSQAGDQTYANDAVVVQAGGTPPSALLERFGIELVTKRGES